VRSAEIEPRVRQEQGYAGHRGRDDPPRGGRSASLRSSKPWGVGEGHAFSFSLCLWSKKLGPSMSRSSQGCSSWIFAGRRLSECGILPFWLFATRRRTFRQEARYVGRRAYEDRFSSKAKALFGHNAVISVQPHPARRPQDLQGVRVVVQPGAGRGRRAGWGWTEMTAPLRVSRRSSPQCAPLEWSCCARAGAGGAGPGRHSMSAPPDCAAQSEPPLECSMRAPCVLRPPSRLRRLTPQGTRLLGAFPCSGPFLTK
jgi:hypothetical protein